jgi:DNA-binding Xre family transcriptional regulator
MSMRYNHFFITFSLFVIALFRYDDYIVINEREAILTIQEKIRVLLVRRGNISEAELARRMGILPQNFSRKMKVGHFTDTDLEKIAKALNCTVVQAAPVFRMNESGEEI